MWGKITALFATIGFFAAVMFKFLYDKEKAKALIAERKERVTTKVVEAKKKAKEDAKVHHEEVKAKGAVAVANDIADMLDDV